MGRTLVVAAAVALASAVAPITARQQPVPTLRTAVDQVVVDVVVTDEHGGVVPGLAAADFEILEDGKPQAIATFTEIALPFVRREAGAVPPRTPDVRSNRRAADGRVYVLLLDDYFVRPGRTAAVKEVAAEFVRRYVQPGDLVAVASTSGIAGSTQAFTEDMALVTRAVDRFTGRKLPSAQIEKIESAYRAREQDPMRTRRSEPRTAQFNRDGAAPYENAIDADHLERARVSLRTLQGLAEAVDGVPGRRKTIVYVSEGVDVPIKPGDNTQLAVELSGVQAAAARANATIYSLNPRGLHSQGEELMDIQALPSGQTLGRTEDLAALRREQLAGADMLRVVAESTGGSASVETNDLVPALDRIAAESSHYYLIGYASTNGTRDGRYRALDIRVRKAGLRVSARKGYTAPGGKEPKIEIARGLTRDLALLLKRPLPAAGLPLAVHAVAFPSLKDNVSVTVEIGPGALGFEPKGDKRFNAIDVAILPVDGAGRTYGLTQAHPQLTIPPDTADQVSANGLRLSHRLTLPPGAYQLRVAVREAGGGASGSLICDVEVPDVAKPGLVMTPILASSTGALQVPSAYNDDVLARALGGPPTTARTFATAETLSVYAELADVGATAARDVDLLTIVRDARGKDIVRSPQPKANQRVAPGQSFAYSVDLPLKALDPGRYVLRVEARAAGLAEPLGHELPFEVVALKP